MKMEISKDNLKYIVDYLVDPEFNIEILHLRHFLDQNGIVEFIESDIKTSSNPIWIEFIGVDSEASSVYKDLLIRVLQDIVKYFELGNIFDFLTETGLVSTGGIKSGNYYIDYLGRLIETVLKYYMDDSSKTIITDSGFFSFLISLCRGFDNNEVDAKNMGFILDELSKKDVYANDPLGKKVFQSLLEDTFQSIYGELHEPDLDDSNEKKSDKTGKQYQYSDKADSIGISSIIIEKLFFVIQHPAITIIIGDDFKIKDIDVLEKYDDVDFFKIKDVDALEKDDVDDYLEDEKSLSYMNSTIKELSQKVIVLNKEYSLNEVIFIIIKQIRDLLLYQSEKAFPGNIRSTLNVINKAVYENSDEPMRDFIDYYEEQNKMSNTNSNDLDEFWRFLIEYLGEENGFYKQDNEASGGQTVNELRKMKQTQVEGMILISEYLEEEAKRKREHLDKLNEIRKSEESKKGNTRSK